MGDENNRYFDLTILLRFDNLELFEVARKNLFMRIGEYFDLLAEVEDNVPKSVEALSRISDFKIAENDLENLEEIKEKLEKIGYRKRTSAIVDIIKARKSGRIDIAAEGAKETVEDLNKLHLQITASKRAKKAASPKDATEEGGQSQESIENLLLKDALMQLEQTEATRQLRILAVDDSAAILNTITSVLSEEYKVYGMPKPALVEKFLTQITPDLFLLDYEMPEINGFELIPIIRKFEEHKETPIIFLTSLGTVEHVSKAAKLGACDYIIKPFQGDNLREKVAKHITRKKLYY